MPNDNTPDTTLPSEVSGFITEDPAVEEPAVEPDESEDPDDLDPDADEGEGNEGGEGDGDGTDPKKLITSLRRKAARQRVAARTAREEAKAAKEAAQAAVDEAARNATAEREKIGRALAEVFGFAPKEDAPVDPVELANQARAAEEAARQAAEKATTSERKARVELAVLRNAGEDIDADALLDSTSFADSIADLDPSAKDFKAQVKAAIAQAAEDNPRFRKAPAKPPAGRSGADLTAGSAEPSKAGDGASIADLIAARRKKRGVSL